MGRWDRCVCMKTGPRLLRSILQKRAMASSTVVDVFKLKSKCLLHIGGNLSTLKMAGRMRISRHVQGRLNHSMGPLQLLHGH